MIGIKMRILPYLTGLGLGLGIPGTMLDIGNPNYWYIAVPSAVAFSFIFVKWQKNDEKIGEKKDASEI